LDRLKKWVTITIRLQQSRLHMHRLGSSSSIVN